ncbi:hypothetical protein Tco_1420265 [Tanacetum coccineum]
MKSLYPLPYVDLQAPEVIAPIPKVVAPEHAVLTSSPSSTTVDEDAPSPTLVITLKWIYKVKLDELGDLRGYDEFFLSFAAQYELLFNQMDVKTALNVDTPMVEKSKLDKDKEGKALDLSHYRGMELHPPLSYMASIPTYNVAICMCARYQARPTEKHLNEVKRIFRYLKGTVHRGLWYPKDSSIALTAFADADHAGCQDTRRSTSGSIMTNFG